MQSLLFFLIIILLLHCLAAQVSPLNILNQGDSLNSSSKLVSDNNNFTLGFFTPENTNNTYLAVRFIGQSSYLGWIGNRDNPVHRNSNPILTIDEAGNLIINHTRGEPVPVFSSVLIRNNLSATLLDSGNFVVSEMNSSILWQSFDYPTDTLMPGMKLGTNHRAITSWFNQTNPATGAFTMEWDPIVGQLLIRRRGVVYWASGRKRDYYEFIGGFRINRFENIDGPDALYLYHNFTIVRNGEEEYVMYTSRNDRNRVVGLRLDSDGDIHDTFRLAPVITSSNCYGYETEQPGCQLWDQPPYRNNRMTFDLRAGSFVGVEDYRSDYNSNLRLSDCRYLCWDDCECAAYFLSGGSGHGCEFVIGRNAKFVQNLDGGASSASLMYIIITAPAAAGKVTGLMKITLGVLSAIVVLSLGTTFFVLRILQLRKREAALHELLTLDGYTDDNGRGSTNHYLRPFTYSSIQLATHNFSSQYKLGQGGFGPVYKGKTSEGKDIAVKLLSRQSGQGLLEFKTELILISKLQHVNLVKLIGFCVHKDDKMIIYDYMPNKSLDFFLFDEGGKLDWQKRFSIIGGIAQGLLYLHKYSRLKIIHRDLKPSNILLDQNMIPKISDFGLARIFKHDISEANTHTRVGTYGYMAPEYAMQGIFSVKSDVYSFGVLILEIVSGRKNNSFHEIEGPLSLVEYAWKLWKKDHLLVLMDPTLRGSCVIDQLQRCIHIGLLCVENHAVDRPTIEDITSMLKNEMTNFPMPKCPAFITRNNVIEELEHIVPEKLSSANEITLSETGGR